MMELLNWGLEHPGAMFGWMVFAVVFTYVLGESIASVAAALRGK